VQEKIPAPRKARPSPLLKRWTFCIQRAGQQGGQWLIEQRPKRGRWAGMWQFPTIEAGKALPTSKTLTGKLPVGVSKPRLLGVIAHALTHRRYEFSAFQCEAVGAGTLLSDRPRRWIAAEQLVNYPLSRPQVKIAGMAGVIQ
jgi:adenine-specific DNA glycosylase